MPRSKKTKYYESESEDDAPPPAKKGRQPVATNGNYSDSEDEDDEYDHAPQKSGKVVSTWGSKVIYKSDSEASFTDAGEVDDDADSDYGSSKKKKSTPARKSPKKKTPAKKSSKKSPAAKKGSAKKTPAKKTPAKKTPAKKGSAKKKTPASARTLASVRRQSKVNYADSPSEDEEESESEEEEESESEDEVPIKRGKKGAKGKPQKKAPPPKKKTPQHPPVGEMIIAAIKALRDHPRKGSSMAAIKGYMGEEWGINIQSYAVKIKKAVQAGIEKEFIIQTKGKGLNGRFTVPGLKARKKKRKNALTKKYDEDEVEYQPQKTQRAEDKEKTAQEIEERRQQLKSEAVRKELEKASRPKKPAAPRQTEWEVEMITKMKVMEDETYYKVKWVGSTKQTWEPEDNLFGAQDAIDNFLLEEKSRISMLEKMKKEREESGEYEVSRILDVENPENARKRTFLVRWKFCGPDDDTWEPEENLNCPELIEKFMEKWQKSIPNEKTLREAPKKIERLIDVLPDPQKKSRRVVKHDNRSGKRSGFRVTYYDMDED